MLMIHFLPGDPSADPKIHGDPFKTIFVGRIVSESKASAELTLISAISAHVIVVYGLEL